MGLNPQPLRVRVIPAHGFVACRLVVGFLVLRFADVSDSIRGGGASVPSENGPMAAGRRSLRGWSPRESRRG